MIRRILCLVFLLIVSSPQVVTTVHAQSAVNRADVQQRIEEAKARLHLTDQQVDAIKPLAMAEADKLRAIRAKYGDNLTRRDKYNLLREAKSVADSFNAGMSHIVDADQMVIWKQMQDEKRAQLKAEYQRRQAAGN